MRLILHQYTEWLIMLSVMHPVKVMLTNLQMKILWIEPIGMVYAMSMKVNTMCA